MYSRNYPRYICEGFPLRWPSMQLLAFSIKLYSFSTFSVRMWWRGAEGREGKETCGRMWLALVSLKFSEVVCLLWEWWSENLECWSGLILFLMSLIIASLHSTVNLPQYFFILLQSEEFPFHNYHMHFQLQTSEINSSILKYYLDFLVFYMNYSFQSNSDISSRPNLSQLLQPLQIQRVHLDRCVDHHIHQQLWRQAKLGKNCVDARDYLLRNSFEFRTRICVLLPTEIWLQGGKENSKQFD